ncbi:transmembrane and coiled-coil domains protein 1b isoform X1 [Alosa sapidissima]|uniref:transmembrane and coiled-coil domains protein 1b isoform X1 n=1 Tax=Alosa sapidissima TaxID=34773 RepID=UPI001C08DB74|nr:transmembrane and coiled-coil domains protein 1b isoform X1 [Alosa sapidissima]
MFLWKRIAQQNTTTSPFIQAKAGPPGCVWAGCVPQRAVLRLGRGLRPGRGRQHARPAAHQAGHRPAAAEDPQADRADQDRADGARRQRGRVPEAGQQRRQAAERAHQAGVREEEPEVGADHPAAAAQAGALPPQAARGGAQRHPAAAQGRPPRHAPGPEGRGRQGPAAPSVLHTLPVVTGGLSSFSQATHSAAGAVVSKPREIASLIRNKFGSADNIAGLKDSLDETQGEDGGVPGPGARALGGSGSGGGHLQSSPKYGSEDDCSSATSGSAGANSTTGAPGGPPSSRGNTLEHGQSLGLEALYQEVQELRDSQGRLEESFESLKAHYQKDYTLIMQALQEERYRCERLEEQLNDLTELHQNEILNLKQELASMEEKIAYQSYERARDIQEALEACQTRISKMELQQQQQQVVQLEGLENATARTLLGKLINVLLALMAVLLVFVSTVANCVVPLMKTRSRTLSTLLLVLLLAFLWRHWEVISQYLDRFLLHPR